MHALTKMPLNILKFSTANNFSGQIGEHALKGIVKDHAQRTQRRPDKFAEQCALSEYEKNILDYVMDDMTRQIGFTRRTHTEHSQDAYKVKGEYTLLLSLTNRGGLGTSSDRVSWHCSKQDCLICLGNTILVKLELWELVIVFNNNFYSATNLCLPYASAKCGR